ncbi:hypothetical protein M1247_12970 [Mycobacterium sp. 21AC1]|uniref:hypothetical protein n=1 Tax=[Mycobacterium] appelbergii TaxID=2939269 RepID=UPI0029392059|nr:hypothetical protein [Mycobacterium sp. 21AC1]MDV3125833.1 hypothetical protein [Mycobacterium sp. 21AC1]
MHEQELDDQLQRRIALLESSDSAEHLVDDLPISDIAMCVIALAFATVVLLWWAY